MVKQRKFNGKVYDRAYAVHTKKRAQNEAKRLRSKGMLARVVKRSPQLSSGKYNWEIYYRQKRKRGTK